VTHSIFLEAKFLFKHNTKHNRNSPYFFAIDNKIRTHTHMKQNKIESGSIQLIRF